MTAKKRNQYEFDKRKYDHIHLQVEKGEKDKIKAHAIAVDGSINKYINRLIREDMDAIKEKGLPS